MLFPEWFLPHPARKVLLYREPEEVNQSLDTLGLPKLDIPAHNARVHAAIKGGIPIWHWDAVLDKISARKIWEHLLPRLPFDEYRHDLLSGFNVQPHWRRLPVSKEAVADLIRRATEVVV